jgi:hypothetical protein
MGALATKIQDHMKTSHLQSMDEFQGITAMAAEDLQAGLGPEVLQDTVSQVQEMSLEAQMEAETSRTSLESELLKLVEHLRIKDSHSDPGLQDLNQKLEEMTTTLLTISTTLSSIETKLSALNLSSFVSTKASHGSFNLRSALNLESGLNVQPPSTSLAASSSPPCADLVVKWEDF